MRAATEQTAQSLREDILSGAIAAGARLGEADLAERLHVSRTPVREALHRLAAEGLVELQPNRGARVATWGRDELVGIFVVRLQLEPYAVRCAVPRLSSDDLDDLDRLAQEMFRIGRPGRRQDLDGIVDLNRRFHATFIDSAGNPALSTALRNVSNASVVHRNFRDYTEDAMLRSLHHHLEMVTAARVGNGEWAEAIMRAHLYNAMATMLGPDPMVPSPASDGEVRPREYGP